MLRIAAATLGLLLALASLADAATITPTRFDDPESGGYRCFEAPGDCSLRGALAEARDGDLVQLRPGTYEITRDGAVSASEDITLKGAGTRRTVLARTGGIGGVLAFETPWTPPEHSAQAGDLAPVKDQVATVSRVSVTGGRGVPSGGGIFANDASLRIDEVAVYGNRVSNAGYNGKGAGAGVFVIRSDRLVIANSLIAQNVAEDDGRGTIAGGLYYDGPSALVVNTTLSGNVAEGPEGRGGGFFQQAGASGRPILFASSTLVGNVAHGGGGNVYAFGGEIAFDHTIVGLGRGPTGGKNCLAHGGKIVSLGHNLEAPSTECGFDRTSDLRGITDPMLGPLGDHGGQTDSFSLRAGSPAIDRSTPPCLAADQPLNRDQRRARRPAGGRCDIGAFEVVSPKDEDYEGCRVIAQPRQAGRDVLTGVECGTTGTASLTASVIVPQRSARSVGGVPGLIQVVGRSRFRVAKGRTRRVRTQIPRQLLGRIAESRERGVPVRFVVALRRR